MPFSAVDRTDGPAGSAASRVSVANSDALCEVTDHGLGPARGKVEHCKVWHADGSPIGESLLGCDDSERHQQRCQCPTAGAHNHVTAGTGLAEPPYGCEEAGPSVARSFPTRSGRHGRDSEEPSDGGDELIVYEPLGVGLTEGIIDDEVGSEQLCRRTERLDHLRFRPGCQHARRTQPR